MRELDTSSFNSVLNDKLVELKRIIENEITPENINYFDPLLLTRAQSFLDKLYTYDSFSNINSVDTYKLNTMVNYLKVNKFEYTNVFKILNIESDDYDAVIDIPDGFDGRNSFTFTNVNYELLESFADNSWEEYSEAITDAFNSRVSGNQDADFTCYLIRNKNNIKVITRNLLTAFADPQLTTHTILWRRR